jgi:hypothetical protein
LALADTVDILIQHRPDILFRDGLSKFALSAFLPPSRFPGGFGIASLQPRFSRNAWDIF